jgi:hypothetical protein
MSLPRAWWRKPATVQPKETTSSGTLFDASIMIEPTFSG